MSTSPNFPASNPSTQKQISAAGDFLKSKEFMGTDYFQNHNTSGGLSRFRSAPSSFLEALLDSNTDNNSSSGDEAEAFFSSLIDAPKNTMKQETQPQFRNGSYSLGMENQLSVGNGSNLVRQSSSPTGFFNGFGIMGEVGNYRVQNHAEVTCSTTRFMSSIPENVNETVVPTNHRQRNDEYCSETSLKRTRYGDQKTFSDINRVENQNGARKRMSGLVSHMSLPKTSAEMAVLENYVHFQPEITVPCQVRAKRGFATHPRSIAERVRRTRISKNIKKLQDLFPDMDKQMNTADMLDLAVDYIKDLQEKIEGLRDTKGKCICLSNCQQKSPG